MPFFPPCRLKLSVSTVVYKRAKSEAFSSLSLLSVSCEKVENEKELKEPRVHSRENSVCLMNTAMKEADCEHVANSGYRLCGAMMHKRLVTRQVPQCETAALRFELRVELRRDDTDRAGAVDAQVPRKAARHT